MKKNIESIGSVLDVFEQASIQHTMATENGDFKTGNKAYKSIATSINWLKEKGEIDRLLPFLNHTVDGVRVWAASFLIHTHETRAVMVLENISTGTNIIAFNAKMTLEEWEKGNLKS